MTSYLDAMVLHNAKLLLTFSRLQQLLLRFPTTKKQITFLSWRCLQRQSLLLKETCSQNSVAGVEWPDKSMLDAHRQATVSGPVSWQRMSMLAHARGLAPDRT